MNEFRTRNFYEACYLMTLGAPEPRCEGVRPSTFVFEDPDGEVRWLHEGFLQDATAQAYNNAAKKLRSMLTTKKQEREGA